MELAVAVGDVVQAPKDENLARGEGDARDDDLAEEAHATLSAMFLGLATRRVPVATAEQ